MRASRHFGEPHATKRLKTGAITPKTSQAMGAPSFSPYRSRAPFSPNLIGCRLLAIGYSERASGESPATTPSEKSGSTGIARSTGAHHLPVYRLHGTLAWMVRPIRRRRRFRAETDSAAPFAPNRQKGILPAAREKPIRWGIRNTSRLGPGAKTILRRVHSD